ncbi:MAG: hypothetical protein HC870_01590 [Rhizobiales bacterium]|nr:hypothetical protein [Hyphomicrobiales bacterium]
MKQSLRAKRTVAAFALCAAAVTTATSLGAQQQAPSENGEVLTTVYGNLPRSVSFPKGPRSPASLPRARASAFR